MRRDRDDKTDRSQQDCLHEDCRRRSGKYSSGKILGMSPYQKERREEEGGEGRRERRGNVSDESESVTGGYRIGRLSDYLKRWGEGGE